MNKLDDATLASAVRALPRWFSSCENDEIWRKICNSIWPSTTDPRLLHAITAFSSTHRSFYFDSTLSASYRLPTLTSLSATSELISAVDIYYKDQVIHSKVLQTGTVTERFFSHPFTLNALDPTERIRTPLKYDGDYSATVSLAVEHLRVSWIVIDPHSKRAVNIASHVAVASQILANGDIELCYATVAADASGKLVLFAVRATCGWMGREELHLKMVTMEITDVNRRILNGRESLWILQAAMEGRRRRIDSKKETDAYKKFKWKAEKVMVAILSMICLMLLILILVGWMTAALILLLRY
ncbi:F-box protein At2g27310-like [Henckelia pumila]|uniref:F-box protein At2g27310-like n=1 Tax=Henckelia pumila TaxID=405737 RepID=UPI003C6DD5D7